MSLIVNDYMPLIASDHFLDYEWLYSFECVWLYALDQCNFLEFSGLWKRIAIKKKGKDQKGSLIGGLFDSYPPDFLVE